MTQEEHKKTFFSLLENCEIQIFEAFAGTCNGSSSMKQQYNGLVSAAGRPAFFDVLQTEVDKQHDKQLDMFGSDSDRHWC